MLTAPADPFRFVLDGTDAHAVARRQLWLVPVGLAFLGAALFVYLN